ncbi:hypothetical protein VSR01_15535 [Actinacidiphila sp. DG2A-62]|uniref:hypothetical protein n=1 Tax=Actinacidiphila sp. DG2A-62 TaxID=3108821 RepID=UPI002DB5BF39|nr:hypothetical protein [Actinacidiphila sp. DG2A-62]MEC3994862.1 hypothetical protein [Actinacidiphila sp. DG2A-62]
MPSRTTTSPNAIRISATTHAWALVMSWRWEKCATCAPPEACEDHTAKPSRKPMLITHRAAAPSEALTYSCRPSPRRTRVSKPPKRPKTMPAPAPAAASTRSLPAVGMWCR